MSRFHFRAVAIVVAVAHSIAWNASALSVEPEAVSDVSLREAVDGRFVIGVGVSHSILGDPEDAKLIKKHFQIITPENCMKPQGIQPLEGEFNFGDTDKFIAFAKENQLAAVGHCLVWAKDDRTSEWMMKDGDQVVGAEKLLRRIHDHIETVMDRYADTVTMWDVVNEALADSDGEYLRDSIYTRTTGDRFLVEAFKLARAKDPDALLIYNDYNCFKPGKREKTIRLLKSLKDQGAPVDAFGMQGHFELGDLPLDDLRILFDQLRALDLKVIISELDIDVVTRGKWWAEDGKYRKELESFDPYKDGCPAEILQQEAEEYAQLFKLFLEYDDVVARVSFWNLHDGQSWLNHFPWKRANYPLLFDRQRQPKPAFFAVMQVLEGSLQAQ